jgi:hypothetical protein
LGQENQFKEKAGGAPERMEDKSDILSIPYFLNRTRVKGDKKK